MSDNKFIVKCKEFLFLLNTDYLTITDILKILGENDNELEMLLVSMFVSLEEGSLCLKLTSDSLLKNLFFVDEKNIKQTLEIFLKKIEQKYYSKIISLTGEDYKPLILKNMGGINYLYFQKYYIYENRLKLNFDRFLEPVKFDAQIKNLEHIKNILSEEIQINNNKFNLNNKQKISVILALIKNFLIISGGPGTGKTSIITTLLRCFIEIGIKIDEIKIATPTGRASQKITDSIRNNILQNEKISENQKKLIIEIESSTIHRLLKYNPQKNNFIYNKNNKLNAKIIIIDEVSMVDVILMNKLLDAIADETKLIFLGDKDQLPSVDAGAILTEFIPQNKNESFSLEFINILKEIIPEIKLTPDNSKSGLTDKVVLLTESYRAKGLVFKIAEKINAKSKTGEDVLNIISEFIHLDYNLKNENFEIINDLNNCFFIEEENPVFLKIFNIVNLLIKKFFFDYKINGLNYFEHIKGLNKYLINETNITEELIKIFEVIFYFVDNFKILTIIKDGYTGSNGINEIIKGIFLQESDDISGLSIIINKNDYQQNLFNGDIGIIIKDKTNRKKVIFKINTNYKIFDLEMLPSNETGFAITVHKSQGSEYENILLVLPDKIDNFLLTKEIIYTGLTRAKKKAMVFGKKDVLKSAITKEINRVSGINLWE